MKQKTKRNENGSRDKKKHFGYELNKYIIQSNSQFTTVEKQTQAINANPNLVKSRHHKFRATSPLAVVVAVAFCCFLPLLFSSLEYRVFTNYGQTLWFVLNCDCGWAPVNLQKRQHILPDVKQVNNFGARLIITLTDSNNSSEDVEGEKSDA